MGRLREANDRLIKQTSDLEQQKDKEMEKYEVQIEEKEQAIDDLTENVEQMKAKLKEKSTLGGMFGMGNKPKVQTGEIETQTTPMKEIIVEKTPLKPSRAVASPSSNSSSSISKSQKKKRSPAVGSITINENVPQSAYPVKQNKS